MASLQYAPAYDWQENSLVDMRSHNRCNDMGLPKQEFSDEGKDYLSLEIFSRNEFTDYVSPQYDHSYDGLKQYHS